MFDQLGGGQSGPDNTYANPKDILNHLLIIWSIDYVEHMPSRFTRPGEKADVVIVDVIDLDVIDPETQQPGLICRKNWWRQARLIRELKGCLGNKNPKLAFMVQGIASQGYPPYELRDATTDGNAVARATAWMQRHPEFKPSEPNAAPYTQHQAQPGAYIQQTTYQPPQPPPYNPAPPSLLEQMASRVQQQPPQPQPWPQQPPQPPSPPYPQRQDQGPIPF